MPHRGLSEADKHARAIQAARRMISGGERPGYRAPWWPLRAAGRRQATVL